MHFQVLRTMEHAINWEAVLNSTFTSRQNQYICRRHTANVTVAAYHDRAMKEKASLTHSTLIFLMNQCIHSSRPWFIPCPHDCIRPHSNAILVCRQPLPLPLPRWVTLFVDPSWPHLSSLFLANQVPFWNLEPPSTMLGWNVLMNALPQGRYYYYI